MKKIAVLFADGTEEIEAISPIDIIRRTGAVCDVISVSGKTPIGSHGVKIFADKLAEETDFSIYDAIVIPGGMPGAINIAKNSIVDMALKSAFMDGKLVAAICASPAVVLSSKGLIKGNATCYPAPDFISALGDFYTGKKVERYKNVITADGPRSAMEFALEICKYLELSPKF